MDVGAGEDIADQQCTMTGGDTGFAAPVVIINVMNVEPYFGIVDMGVDQTLAFTGDCGPITDLKGICDIKAGKSL